MVRFYNIKSTLHSLCQNCIRKLLRQHCIKDWHCVENSLPSCRKPCSCPNQTHQPYLHTHSFIIRWLTMNCLFISSRAVSQPKDIAEHFDNYFTSISKELQKHIPPTKRNFSDNLKNPNAEAFFMTSTTPEEISDLIQTLSWNKSTGPSSILLNHFLEQHKVLYALQFGFCLNTSTNNALMSMTEDIQNKNELSARVCWPEEGLWHCWPWHFTYKTWPLWN